MRSSPPPAPARVPVLLVALAAACAGPPTDGERPTCEGYTCPEDACAQAGIEVPTTPYLSPWEAEVTRARLAEIRRGVVPWQRSNVGLCSGPGPACARYLGVDGGTLAPGPHHLHAEFDVPELGDWPIAVVVSCEIDAPPLDGKALTHEVAHEQHVLVAADSADGGPVRLPPIPITSPDPTARRVCRARWDLPDMAKGDGSVRSRIVATWIVPHVSEVEEARRAPDADAPPAGAPG